MVSMRGKKTAEASMNLPIEARMPTSALPSLTHVNSRMWASALLAPRFMVAIYVQFWRSKLSMDLKIVLLEINALGNSRVDDNDE